MIIILILTILILGAFFIIFSRIGLSKTENITGAFFILTIASLTGIIAGFIINPNSISEFTIIAFAWILLYTFLQNGIGRPLNLLSIDYLGVNRSTPIITTAQIFNVLFAWLIVSESPSLANMIGVIFIVTGCIMVSIQTMNKEQPLALKKKTAILGIIIAITGAIGYGLSAPVAKYALNQSISPGFIVTVSSLITLAAFILPTIKKFNTIKKIPRTGLYALIAGGILSGTINAILIYIISFKEIIYVIPLVSAVPIPTLFIAKILLPKTEVFTKYIILGTILTVIGAILIGLEI